MVFHHLFQLFFRVAGWTCLKLSAYAYVHCAFFNLPKIIDSYRTNALIYVEIGNKFMNFPAPNPISVDLVHEHLQMLRMRVLTDEGHLRSLIHLDCSETEIYLLGRN